MKENFTLTHHAPVTGSASFPLIMNNGNRMENTHPLQNNAEHILVGYKLSPSTGSFIYLILSDIQNYRV
jgi:hypothetical protein